MKGRKDIVWFEEVDKNDVGLVGGKGANLGEMTNARLPIPYGFIVTARAYFDFIKSAKLQGKIDSLLAIVNYNNPPEIQQASGHIQKLILRAEFPGDLAKEIVEYYEQLPLKEEKYFKERHSAFALGQHSLKKVYDPPLVAVRSSATAEDLPNASFAGQQETYLNVKGDAVLIQKVKECWASLFTERAIYYRHEQGFDHFKVGLAAVVQRMVQSEKSGIAFSIDPVSNDRHKIVIEAIFGLGEYIVQGKVTPDHYEVSKGSFSLLQKKVSYQNVKYVKRGTENKEVALSRLEGSRPKLSNEEIVRIALQVADIEKHYYFPQDIEWAIEKGRIYIVQSRPITTMNTSSKINESESLEDQPDLRRFKLLVTGAPASPGIGAGPVTIIFSPAEIDRIKKGDVLVAPQTNPDYVPAMKKASAIITEKGGRTSHAAIVSRELGVPAVVGAEKATTILKHETIVSVNGKTGEVFQGNIPSSIKAARVQPLTVKKMHTLTKVYVNLAEPSQAEKIAKLDVDGVGLLRAEFMIAQIGVHPKEFIRKNKEALFVSILTRDLLKFAKPFSPRPVVYRATDFKTNEYRHLKGGADYEPHEENPMLGFRGAYRYIANPDVFSLELRALKNIWAMGYRNLHLMIPFIRVPWELIRIKEVVRSFGFFDYPDFKLWIMVEVPSAALNLVEFIKIGIDGVSIGSNDLTMTLLGVDRDNEEVAPLYDERNPVVVSVLEQIVKTCSARQITCSICGQAPSDYPELIEKLVRAGITSVSVNPDAITRSREVIYGCEKKLAAKLVK
ncbi:phosphoenolpyruvate synthase [Candidatus Roizmanbacteria bacterium]|nr:phosphoenolpyruvate synthase [Candidatus Roizmanbacteria bacterium]